MLTSSELTVLYWKWFSQAPASIIFFLPILAITSKPIHFDVEELSHFSPISSPSMHSQLWSVIQRETVFFSSLRYVYLSFLSSIYFTRILDPFLISPVLFLIFFLLLFKCYLLFSSFPFLSQHTFQFQSCVGGRSFLNFSNNCPFLSLILNSPNMLPHQALVFCFLKLPSTSN